MKLDIHFPFLICFQQLLYPAALNCQRCAAGNDQRNEPAACSGLLQRPERVCPISNTSSAALPLRAHLSTALDMLLLGKEKEEQGEVLSPLPSPTVLLVCALLACSLILLSGAVCEVFLVCLGLFLS